MNKSPTYRQRLYELIGDNHGIITIAMAAEVGVPAVELRKLTSRGALERAGRGIYRIPFAPLDKFQQAITALATVGEGATLVSTSVLALLDIGLEMPTKLLISRSKRTRAQIPNFVLLSKVRPKQTQIIEGVCCQSVFEILQERTRTARLERVREEILQAEQLGFINEDQANELMSEVTNNLPLYEPSIFQGSTI
jgi:predicted transcriptional regulator of viral defense system